MIVKENLIKVPEGNAEIKERGIRFLISGHLVTRDENIFKGNHPPSNDQTHNRRMFSYSLLN